jgi:hypothetical protein
VQRTGKWYVETHTIEMSRNKKNEVSISEYRMAQISHEACKIITGCNNVDKLRGLGIYCIG